MREPNWLVDLSAAMVHGLAGAAPRAEGEKVDFLPREITDAAIAIAAAVRWDAEAEILRARADAAELRAEVARLRRIAGPDKDWD